MSHTRSGTVYLVLSAGRYPSELRARMTTRTPSLEAGEVAMTVTVKVPDAMFKHPALRATLTIPEDAVSRPQIDAAVVDNIKAELQRTLGVDLTVTVIEPSEVTHG